MPDVKTGTGIPRVVEAVVAAAAIVLLAPVFLLSAALVVAGLGWPVFYRQQRIGRSGQPFTLYKFRTMRPSQTNSRITAADDQRIVPTGRLLRRTKCDELPQLWNVVKGDMSLVGPRPEAPVYVDASSPEWRAVLSVRPGLTDPVTIALRNEESLLASVTGDRELYYRRTLQPFKLRGHAAYLRVRSWRSDIGVLRDTALAVAMPGRSKALTVDDLGASATEPS